MSSKKSWEVKIDPAVYTYLRSLPNEEAEYVVASISAIQEEPFGGRGNLKKMPLGDNEYTWRRRSGAFFVWYDIHQHSNLIHVTLVERAR